MLLGDTVHRSVQPDAGGELCGGREETEGGMERELWSPSSNTIAMEPIKEATMY